jgi:hypothetical protein
MMKIRKVTEQISKFVTFFSSYKQIHWRSVT